MTLTRATLGKLTTRATKDVEIQGHKVRLQKPTPLEFSQYQLAIVDPKTREFDYSKGPAAIALLVARMWIDGEGKRLFADNETKELNELDLEFYQRLSEACQMFVNGEQEPSKVLGESEETTPSDSPAGSA